MHKLEAIARFVILRAGISSTVCEAVTPCSLVGEKRLVVGMYISILSVQVKVRGIRFFHGDCTVYQITRCHIPQSVTFSREGTAVPSTTS